MEANCNRNLTPGILTPGAGSNHAGPLLVHSGRLSTVRTKGKIIELVGQVWRRNFRTATTQYPDGVVSKT